MQVMAWHTFVEYSVYNLPFKIGVMHGDVIHREYGNGRMAMYLVYKGHHVGQIFLVL